MALFQTIVHPTDFDEPSKEAFRVARALAQALGARVVAFHVVPPPAAVTQDGRVVLDPKSKEPVDLWSAYRSLQADTPNVPVQYAVVVGGEGEAKDLLEQKVREFGEGVLLVMGSHGRTGLSRFFWGNRAEEALHDFDCSVLVVKAPVQGTLSDNKKGQATATAKPTSRQAAPSGARVPG
jgi:nucleotide-binding universal stress UspA family protein